MQSLMVVRKFIRRFCEDVIEVIHFFEKRENEFSSDFIPLLEFF